MRLTLPFTRTQSNCMRPSAATMFFGTHVGGRVEPVGDDLLRHPRQDVADVRVVRAEHGDAVERQALQEIDKGALEALEVVAVGLRGRRRCW